MEDELWMRKIKERLEDYSEPLPVSGWERLEKDMPASKPKRRIIPFRRWAVAAAAVLLAAVSSVSIWLLQSPVGEEMRNTATPTLAVVPDELPGRQSPQMRTEVAEPDYRAQGQTATPGGTNRRSLLAQELNVAAETDRQTEFRQPLDAEPEIQGEASEQTPSVEKEEAGTTAAGNSGTESRKVERRRPSGRDKLQLPVGDRKKKKSGGWSVGLAVGNTGGLISGNSIGGGGFMQSDPSFGYSGGKVDLSTIANGIMDVPEGQALVFKNGMPYLMRNSEQIVDIDHKQPLSFGFSRACKGLFGGDRLDVYVSCFGCEVCGKFGEGEPETALLGNSVAGKLELR